ncbi:hypothetical protein FIBSPDRAFT_886187 [Athelia psychrophila]|uniref:Uncharacterized protein n=1 Tax=Athelia psychrophila TaxID=1759441 RepID=A0A166R6T0_9AGAM|nr:hypothetical protein FIBSPDRAFT_886187 [Fibularhizoctonia sp. CBS 109695]
MDELDEEIKRVSAELAWLRGEREEPRGPLGRLRIENWTDAIQLVIMRLVWKIYLEYLLAEISSDCCVVGNGKHRIHTYIESQETKLRNRELTAGGEEMRQGRYDRSMLRIIAYAATSDQLSGVLGDSQAESRIVAPRSTASDCRKQEFFTGLREA